MKLTPLSIFFVNFINKNLLHKVIIYTTRDKFLLTKLTKNIFKEINFINLKISNNYSVKSKSQNICL